MPTFTPTAYAAELAIARAAGIDEAAALTAALVSAGASPAVQAGALDGLANEARSLVVQRVEERDAEAKAKAQPKKPRARRPPAQAAVPVPDAEVDAPALPESERAAPLGL